MNEQRIDVLVEAGRLSATEVDSLGESVLGRALRRRKDDDSAEGLWNGPPIAQFTDSM